MEFNSDTYQDVFKSADKIFLSTKATEVSAGIAAVGLVTKSEDNNPPQVAATSTRGSNRGRGRGRGGNRSGRGGGQTKPNNSNKTVPAACCSNHKKWAAEAWYCLEPLSCPWVNKVQAKPAQPEKNDKN